MKKIEVKIYKNEYYTVIKNFKVSYKISRKLIDCCSIEQVDRLVKFHQNFHGKNCIIETEQII